MGKVLLIDPRGWQGAATGYRPSPNIGLAFLIPVLRMAGHEVAIIDLNNSSLTDQKVLETVKEYQPHLLGLSAKTATMRDARSLARQIKGLMPHLPIVLGGPHTRFTPKALSEEPFFDAVFVGEGESVFPDIVAALIQGRTPEGIKGVITKRDSNFSHLLLSQGELDAIPFPEFDLFPENIRKEIQKAYPLVTSRGCVHKCIYCSVPEISGKRVRRRSPENIIEELTRARKNYGSSGFEIIDDVFNIDMDRCKEFCSELLKANLRMSWSCPNGIRADRIDSDLAKLMRQSGCSNVMLGIESANPDILKAVRKGETLEDMERGIRILQGAGIKVGGYFIIGLPGDSFQSQQKSVAFAKKMDISAHFNMLIPYPGTEIWEWVKTNANFISDIESGLHFADDPNKLNVVFETKDFKASERKKAYEMAHTILRRFDLLIPRNTSRRKYYAKLLQLLLRHDPGGIPSYLLLLLKAAVFRAETFRKTQAP